MKEMFFICSELEQKKGVTKKNRTSKKTCHNKIGLFLLTWIQLFKA